ncbi:similar to Saccharomyces cerevisiae YDR168W CDC37 Essential Hsp90p co-chaperone [Maudiozyma saulgeensis]|uniref:Hsp90 chaperone protein kinase-targeting subunit n=1 Tax=Maudiozyma saulgeensis TaxID=1789683 RepID=A0A1X7R6I0_9SACH|nr:similar to Saccharomyces cerevisiae YDR168W CDC37 Essential Hsp90p co-chaperone [Kazachstania saulgeensis]
MVVDYSKWDKIELSDDSDVEVHPNVDKKSFIRWKQQSIHEERMKRTQDIKNLETQMDMYTNLNKRVDKLLSTFTESDGNLGQLTDLPNVEKYLNENFDKNEKSTGENVDPDIATYNEMVVDLFEQLKRDAVKEKKDPSDAKVIKELILQHRNKIDKVTVEAKTKLKELYHEKELHISSEDIHTGFDSGFMNPKVNAVNTDKDTKKINDAMESINLKASTQPKGELPKSLKIDAPLQFIEYTDEKDMLKLAPGTEAFGTKIPYDNYKMSQEFLLKNMQIISGQQKDALMMKSFEYQMEDKNSPMTYQIIHQSEILSYIREIYDMKKIPFLRVQEMEEVINMFFGKIIFNPANSKGKESFLESVKTKYEHVKNRSEIIKQEQTEESEEGEVEGVETIQLKSLDDSAELEVVLPDFNSEDKDEVKKCEAFNKIPKDMQEALKTQNLDEVNKVFETIQIDEAERILELFNEADIIGVRAVLENEDDFNNIKQDYQQQLQHEGNEGERPTVIEEEEILDTADIVD